MISPFGILFVLYVLWIFILNNKDLSKCIEKYLLLSIITANIMVGYAIKLPGIGELKAYQLLGCLIIFIIIMYSRKVKLNFQYSALCFLFLISIFITSFLQVIFPKYYSEALSIYGFEFNFYTIKSIFNVILSFGLFLVVREKIRDSFIEIYEKRIILIGVFHCLIALIEKLFYNIDTNTIWRDNIFAFFGGSGYVYNPTLRGSNYQLSGLTQEPSELITALIIPLAILFFSKVLNKTIFNKKVDILFLSIYVSVVVLSGAATGFVVLIIMFLSSFLLSTLTIKRLFKMIAITIFIGIVSFFAFYDSIEYYWARIAFLFGGDLEGSGQIRLGSLYDNLEQFLDYPIFGIGLNASQSYSMWFAMLANLGICGVLSYGLLLISIVISNNKTKTLSQKRMAYGYAFFMICGIFTLNINIIFLIPHWIMLAIISVNRREGLSIYERQQ